MKVVSTIFSYNTLIDMFKQTLTEDEKYSVLNGANGDQLTIEPDKPSIGWVTVTCINQLEEGDDVWDNLEPQRI